MANFAVKTDHLIQTVWNFATSQSVTKKYTVNFFYPHGDENINSPRSTWQFFLIKMLTWFLAYETTILHWWFSYSNHLSATKTYWNRTEKQRDDSPCKLQISNPSKDWKLIKQTCKSLFNTAVEFLFFDSSWNIKKSQYFVNKNFCYRFSILLVVGIKDKNCRWKNFLTSKVNDDFTVQQGFWKMIGNSKLNLTASSPWKLQYLVLANNNKTTGSSFVFHVKTRIFFNQNKDHPMNS